MSKRKKHNPAKRHATYSRALLRKLNAMVAWVAGQNENACVLVSIKTGKKITMMPELERAISEVQHDWSIYCAAFGRRHDGEEYMMSSIVHAPRCYQSQISDQLGEIHTGILRGMNPHHRVGLGWIACPWGGDISEKAAGELFDALGGWSAKRADIEGEVA